MDTAHPKVTNEILEFARSKMLEVMQKLKVEGISLKEAIEIAEGSIIGAATDVFSFEAVTDLAYEHARSWCKR